MPAKQYELLRYPHEIESTIRKICSCLHSGYAVSKRCIALLLLQRDLEVTQLVEKRESRGSVTQVLRYVREAELRCRTPVQVAINTARHDWAKRVATRTTVGITTPRSKSLNPGEVLSWLSMNPVTGIPILALVLYALYQFVGVFGAGIAVDFLEGQVFDRFLTPSINAWVDAHVPYPFIADLLAHDYGILTLGFRYALAIILPIVGTFFLAFSLIEDSGYLPRLAMMTDRIFKYLGLNGRAVIPITLGFGCGTMATIVSRTLETRRERIIATLLLALAIPCSAQLGVIMALLSETGVGLLIWISFILVVFLFVGYLTARLLPGTRPSFQIEIPPLRLPSMSNVVTKTYTRLQWYLIEVLPTFIAASVLIWAGYQTGLFNAVLDGMKPLVNLLGLPDRTAQAFLFGFFRRDYGAAGLYDLKDQLTGAQMVVAASTLTLFIPCVAQFTVMVKERGLLTALAMFAFIFPFALAAGYALNTTLRILNLQF